MVAVGVALALVSVACADNGSSEGDSELSAAGKLASLDFGEVLSASDPRIVDYEEALGRLGEKCGGDLDRLADRAVVAQEGLLEEGVSESLLSILESVNASVPSEAQPEAIAANDGCPVLFAAYVALRTS